MGRPPPRPLAFDYDRTVIAFHGTRKTASEALADGVPFGPSENDDDWPGHGVYFWEYAPQQAWWWAERRHGDDAAVVGALVPLGRCIDLLDPNNATLLTQAHDEHPPTPPEPWSPADLLAALLRGTDADKRSAMIEAGIIDADGNPTGRYSNWGDKVTRTLDYGVNVRRLGVATAPPTRRAAPKPS